MQLLCVIDFMIEIVLITLIMLVKCKWTFLLHWLFIAPVLSNFIHLNKNHKSSTPSLPNPLKIYNAHIQLLTWTASIRDTWKLSCYQMYFGVHTHASEWDGTLCSAVVNRKKGNQKIDFHVTLCAIFRSLSLCKRSYFNIFKYFKMFTVNFVEYVPNTRHFVSERHQTNLVYMTRKDFTYCCLCYSHRSIKITLNSHYLSKNAS